MFVFERADVRKRTPTNAAAHGAMQTAQVHAEESVGFQGKKATLRRVSRCLNSYRSRWENFWASGTYSRVELVGDEDVLSKMAYTLSNPVAAGLGAHSEDWPGVRSGTLRKGSETITVKKPSFFFRKNGPLPDLRTRVRVAGGAGRGRSRGSVKLLVDVKLRPGGRGCK